MRASRKGKALLAMPACQAGSKQGYLLEGSKSKRAARLQQHSMLCERRRPARKPRKAFRAGLLKLLEAQKSCGFLIFGDFNEVFGDDKEGMLHSAGQMGLAGIMQAKLGEIGRAHV